MRWETGRGEYGEKVWFTGRFVIIGLTGGRWCLTDGYRSSATTHSTLRAAKAAAQRILKREKS